MKTVLIVDDTSVTMSLIRAAIEDIEGLDIEEAHSGFEALKVLPRQSFDIILVDINMPDINGLELLNFIKTNEHYKTIPVIIISTESSEEDRKKGISLGAAGYLTKPFSPEDLQETVKKHLKL